MGNEHYEEKIVFQFIQRHLIEHIGGLGFLKQKFPNNSTFLLLQFTLSSQLYYYNFMNKNTLFRGVFLLSGVLSGLFAQNESPRYEVFMQTREEYTRSPLFLGSDETGSDFEFTRGLEILTDIPKVKVYISDKEAGRTPFEDSELPLGYYRIRLEKPGYRDLEVRVLINQNKRTILKVNYNEEITEETEDKNKYFFREGAFYSSFNPDDPLFFTRIHFSRDLFTNIKPDIVVIDNENYPLITLNPSREEEGFYTYYWDGLDIEGNAVSEGNYQIYSVENYEISSPFSIKRGYTRKAASSFSGFSGLSLVSAAQLIFPGSFQFGSFFSGDSWNNGDENSVNIPFSFFLRFSPLGGWESSMNLEVSMQSDDSIPLVKASTSQKVQIYSQIPFMIALDSRFSYRSDINDLNEVVYNHMVRDPAGASLAIPVQFKVDLWDIYLSPEFLYSFAPLTPESSLEDDFTGVFRWGVSYTDRYFQAAYSNALYSLSYRENPIIVQTAIDLNFFLPGSPLYILMNMVYQKTHNTSNTLSFGTGIGFLL